MKLGDSFSSAIRSITTNKLRSFLTMLGVVIGVGSVIAMIGIGEGTKKKSLDNIQVMGTNMLMVMPNWRRGNVAGAPSDVPTLKEEDVSQLKKDVPLIQFITGSVGARVMAKYKGTSYFTSVTGAQPQIKFIRNSAKMLQGDWYTLEDDAIAARVCVLGYVAYQELFGDENAVGATIRIKGENFTVKGVIAYKGGSGNWNPDDQIYIPLTTGMSRLLGKKNLDMIQIQGSNTELLTITQTQVEDSLGKKRKNAGGEPLFRVMNQGDMIEQMQTQTQLLSVLLAGIGSISLLVGGIGIMNIMLVSVTERTREIGLRKAIGATRQSILWQFLLESVVMCTVGGLIGITLGLGTVIVIAGLLKVPPIVNMFAMVIAFAFSAGVGLFFGLYPAMRASRLQPIVALRSE